MIAVFYLDLIGCSYSLGWDSLCKRDLSANKVELKWLNLDKITIRTHQWAAADGIAFFFFSWWGQKNIALFISSIYAEIVIIMKGRRPFRKRADRSQGRQLLWCSLSLSVVAARTRSQSRAYTLDAGRKLTHQGNGVVVSGRPGPSAAACRKCEGVTKLRCTQEIRFSLLFTCLTCVSFHRPAASGSCRPVMAERESRQLVMMLRLLFYGPRRVKCLVFYAAACAMLFPWVVEGGLLCLRGGNCGLAKAKVDSHALDFGYLTLMKLVFCFSVWGDFTVAFADLTGCFVLFVLTLAAWAA